MAIGTAALINLAPIALKGISGALGIGKNKPTQQERRLLSMADLFGAEASRPLTETRAFKSGMSVLGERDKKNRKAIDNQSAVTGATDEAKLATIQDSNESLNTGLQRLLDYAERSRAINRSQEMNALNMGSQLAQNRRVQSMQNLNSIFDPLSAATKAFTMSDLFDFTGAGDKKSEDDTEE